jgi:hypothetical protein
VFLIELEARLSQTAQVANILKLTFAFQYFVTDQPTHSSFDSWIKKVVLSLAERDLGPKEFSFLVATKFMSELISKLVAKNPALKCERTTGEFRMVTWTLMTRNTKFFDHHRSLQTSLQLQQDPVTSKYERQKFVWVPRAKLQMDQALRLTAVEDVTTCKEAATGDQSPNDFMGHTLGHWELDKTYWLNFHQHERELFQLEELQRLILNLS